jgi:hypothetical protein
MRARFSVIPVDGGLGTTLFSATFLPERCLPLGLLTAHAGRTQRPLRDREGGGI